MTYPIPEREPDRLEALRRYEILDTAPEAIFDHAIRALAASLKVPVALISLVDENRQWFKSVCGLDVRETSREVAFCAHTILTPNIMVVPDACLDKRFASNPLVIGPPFIRFYAGVPLRTPEGHNIGTLCIVDTKPRELCAEEITVLAELAELVIQLFDLRLKAQRVIGAEQSARVAAEQRNVESIRLLDESKERFLEMASHVPGIVYQFKLGADGKMSFPYVSPSIRRILGLDPDAVMRDANVLFDIVLAEDRANLDATIVESYRTLQPWNWEGRARNAEGKVTWFQGTSTPKRMGDGSVLWSGLILDQTLLHTTQEQLRHAQKMEAVGQLTGGVAHDFNNLLAVIGGNAELLSDLAGEGAENLRAIERAVKRGAQLTHDLLAFSRRQPLRPVPVDVALLLDGTLRLLRPSLGETITVHFDAAPQCWRALVDPGQLENAIVNLGINARDAMPSGGDLTVSCSNISLSAAAAAALSGPNGDEALDQGDYVAVSVRDNGTGMPEIVRARAFEPFFTTKEVGKGSGLGLSMVYGFARQSKGLAVIESAPGEGTTVSLYLPRCTLDSASEEGAREGDIPLGGGQKVLVIEDDEDVGNLILRILKSLRYVPLLARDAGTTAALIADVHGVDAVLSDIVLPGGVSGPEFIRSLLREKPGLAVVFMSGYPQSFLENFEGDNLGRPQFLSKPFKKEALAMALHKALAT